MGPTCPHNVLAICADESSASDRKAGAERLRSARQDSDSPGNAFSINGLVQVGRRFPNIQTNGKLAPFADRAC